MKPASWDNRVVSPSELDFLRRVQRSASCRLAGGTALSGAHLRHRLSRDLDLFCDERDSVRGVLAAAEQTVFESGGTLRVARDGGTFVRATLVLPDRSLELDIAYEPSEPLSPRDVVDGVTVDGLADLHANKLTCLLSRSEPRDLVDLFFLDRAGVSPESALENALTKDAGIDPGLLSHLLGDFPTQPLPHMLCPFTEETLRAFRTDLVERFRRAALPSGR